jgi:hypothetical protein
MLENKRPKVKGSVVEVTLGNLSKLPLGLHLYSGLYNFEVQVWEVTH